VREKAVDSLREVGLRISLASVYSDFLPLVKRMKKGDLYSMRISATFLYAYIYPRLDKTHKQITRKKFAKLVKDDTPMVRRGAA
jgi:hypothetical protein